MFINFDRDIQIDDYCQFQTSAVSYGKASVLHLRAVQISVTLTINRYFQDYPGPYTEDHLTQLEIEFKNKSENLRDVIDSAH